MDPKDKIDLINTLLRNYRCGDSGCIFGASGQCTNGGCRCFRAHAIDELDAQRRRMTVMVNELRMILDDALRAKAEALGRPSMVLATKKKISDQKIKDLPDRDRFATLDIE